MNAPLYEIAAGIQEILAADDWTDDHIDALDGLTMALEHKAEGIASLVRATEAKAAEIGAEIERLSAWRKSCDGKATWMKQYLLNAMQAAQRSELETPHYRLRIQKNPPAAIETISGMTPARYLVVIPETSRPDKKAIADDLKKGEAIPGWELRQTERLVLK